MIEGPACPSCGKPREFSSKLTARRARQGKTKCQACANSEKMRQPLRFGFSEAEFNAIRCTATRRGKEWNFTIAELHDLYEEQDGKCAVTGVHMRKYPRAWSIDRIDNACGYTKSNIQLVLKSVNMMRGPLELGSFFELCRSVANHRSENETD